RMKGNEQTSHIPIVMLTARADQGSREEGLEIGADAYLTKPFGTKELLVRVKNLLSQRELLRDHFKKEVFLKPKDVAITSKEEEFLNSVMESIDQHLGDEYFNVDLLAEEVGLSRQQITKRLNLLTGHTPNQLIQKFRLDRAKELLQHDAGRIAEIAYEVGFSSPAYFTKVFKEKFGMSPREFKKAH
ncbi:MAG: response regulator transcription factor, partial [Cyclobacteriaceae bacterium]